MPSTLGILDRPTALDHAHIDYWEASRWNPIALNLFPGLTAAKPQELATGFFKLQRAETYLSYH